MAIDLNMDIGDIIKALTKKKGDDSGDSAGVASSASGGSNDIVAKILPFKNAIIFFLVSAIVFSLYISMYYIPTKEENEKKLKEIARLEGLKQETINLENKIKNLKSKLGKSREKYVESLSHFGNSEDLGELYRSVSTLASKYDLVVLNIKEIEKPKAQPLSKKEQKAKEKAEKEEGVQKKKSLPEVKEIQVEVEIKGRYAEYMKFKEDLAVAEMLLKVNSENIKVKTDKEDAGNIFVTLNMSTYAIDKSQFAGVMDGVESK